MAEYVNYMATKNKSAPIRISVNSLRIIFRLSKHPDPTKQPEVGLALKRMHRKIGRYQDQATPLTRNIFKELLEQCSTCAQGDRDRVLLILGYETMRRRSELYNSELEDLTRFPGRGHALMLTRSNTVQEGKTTLIPISAAFNNLLRE